MNKPTSEYLGDELYLYSSHGIWCRLELLFALTPHMKTQRREGAVETETAKRKRQEQCRRRNEWKLAGILSDGVRARKEYRFSKYHFN